jgi:hypothetical protein
VGPGADVYTLGLVLLECLSGRRAFEGTPSEIAGARLHRDPAIPGDLGEDWRSTISAMTARSPIERLSAATAANQLGLLARGGVPAEILPQTPWLYDAGAMTVPFAVGDTQVFEQTATQYQAKSAAVVHRRRWRRITRRRAAAVVIAVIVVGLVVGLTLVGVLSHSRPPVKVATGTSTSVATSTIATTSTTIATSTIPVNPVATTSVALGAAISSGVASGAITAQAGQQLTSQLTPLLTSNPTAQPQQQVQQFDQLVQQFNQAVQNGQIVGASTIGSLTSSLNALAAALGTSAPDVLSGTPTGVSGVTGNGNGHGHGHHD